MKQEYFEIGQIVNHFGIKGMVKVNPFTDDISQFEEAKIYSISKRWKAIQKSKLKKQSIVRIKSYLKLKGIDTVEEAEKYRGCYLKIARSNSKKASKRYLFYCRFTWTYSLY